MKATDASANPPLSRRAKLVLALLLLLGTWALAELGALFAFGAKRGTLAWIPSVQHERARVLEQSSVQDPLLGRVHPYLGFVEVPPEVGAAGPNGEGVRIPVSSFGFVGHESPLHRRSADSVIVGILGGSFASYVGQHGAATLARLLEASPRYAGRTVVVENLALGGYKQPQQLMTLAYLLSLGAEFDVLVNIDGFNEVALHAAENAPKQVFPAFPRSWYSRIAPASDPAAFAMTSDVRRLQARRTTFARWFGASPWRSLPLANLLWKVADHRTEGAIQARTEAYRTATPDDVPYVASGPRWAPTGDSALYAHLVDLWAQSSVQLARLSRANGIDYFHFLQPNQYVAGSKPMGAAERARAIRADQPYREGAERGYPLLVEAGARLTAAGVAFTDLTRAYADVPEPLYIDDCCHVSARGSEIVAQRIADVVLAR